MKRVNHKRQLQQAWHKHVSPALRHLIDKDRALFSLPTLNALRNAVLSKRSLVHDWRNYVDLNDDEWYSLTHSERILLYLAAVDKASSEEWE